MNNWPQPFWATVLAVLGVVVALTALFHPGTDVMGSAVIQIASNLVSGALGAFAGHALAVPQQVKTTPSGTTVTVNSPTEPPKEN
jgi:hypothetical protein